MDRLDHTVASLAETQHGLVSWTQLSATGASSAQIRRRTATGHLRPVYRGVYRVAGSPDTHAQRLLASVLFSGPGSAASHRSAALLHGLLRIDEMVELCTPRRRRARSLPETTVVHTSIVLPRSDLTTVGRIPCTTVERTLIDLGAVVSRGRVAVALDTALRESKTDLSLLTYVHARRRGRGRRGAGVLARVLDDHAATGTTESPYERRLVDAILDCGLPLPTLQHEVHDGGRLLARLDLAWPAAGIAVEVDGHGYHASRDQRASDATRQNRLVALGWTVYRFTTDQIATDLPGTLAQLAPLIRSCDG